jgi:hypothetical protein
MYNPTFRVSMRTSGENSTSQECRRVMLLRMIHNALYETSSRLQDTNYSPALKTEQVTSENIWA